VYVFTSLLTPVGLDKLTLARRAVMPAKAALFDQRGRSVHDFGTNFYNYISFNAHGRLVALAGFGNLRGQLDIFDRRTLAKVATMDASNTSFCEWSPDGRFILTATLSPRLRVDNGIKIWHCTGPLMHLEMVDELYQASWRPLPIDSAPQFGQTIPAAPAPHSSVLNVGTTVIVATPVKAAYRPPGARGLEASDAYKRSDSNGTLSGQSTPARHHSPAPNGRRYVPGAAPKSSSPAPDGERKGGVGGKKKKGGKSLGGSGLLGPGGHRENGNTRPSADVDNKEQVNGSATVPEPLVVDADAAAAMDAVSKKVRNLNKKVRPPAVYVTLRNLSWYFAVEGHRRAERKGKKRRKIRGDTAQEDRHGSGDQERVE
jgi:translation initiation factor 2A